MRYTLVAAVMAAALFVTGPSLAGSDQPGSLAEDTERAQELAREGISKFIQSLELFLGTIPQYEAPEVTEDGDIIIRRKRGYKSAPPKRAGCGCENEI